MKKKYLVRLIKKSYLELEIETDSADNALIQVQTCDRKKEFDDKYHDVYGAETYPSSVDMICRTNDKGQRARIPHDENDQEIDEVDEREWDRGK